MRDEDLVREALTIDPGRSTIVLIVGGKGSGKSAAARTIFDGWEYDRVVIDPTGDAKPDDPFTIPMAAPFPSQLPEPDYNADPPQDRVTVWARTRPGASAVAEQDSAMQMALHPRRRTKLIWRDEFGLGTTAHKMGDADQLALMSSRHYHATLILCCPRPRHIPPLALLQADMVLMYAVRSPDDREHIAKNFGVSVPLLERQYHDNQRRHKHAFLLLHREHDAILNCPPLPGITARGPRA